MSENVSVLSLIAAVSYLLIASLCLLAMRSNSTDELGKTQSGQAIAWCLIAIFFVALAAMRFFAIEDAFRGELRSLVETYGDYYNRRAYQLPIALVLMAVSCVGVLLGFRRYQAIRQRGRRLLALFVAKSCCAAMIALIGFRLISLHAIDTLLYGPLKLNWLTDLGLSLIVAACALYSMKVAGGSRLNHALKR